MQRVPWGVLALSRPQVSNRRRPPLAVHIPRRNKHFGRLRPPGELLVVGRAASVAIPSAESPSEG